MTIPSHVIHSLQIVGWFSLIFANVVYDSGKIKQEKGINHVVETVIRIIVGLLYAAIVFRVYEDGVWFQDVTIFMVTSFWIFFELFLNLAIDKHPLYLGTTSKMDRWFKKNFGVYIGLKLFALVLFVYSIIQVYRG